MIYTPKTKAAMKLCYEAHKDQLDKSGMPYVFHPFHLAEQMQTEETVCTALLHDVVEDTDYTFDDIRGIGMSDAVVEALELLTHDPAVEYMDYVAAVAKNPIACAVKIADLKHNSDRSRVEQPTEKLETLWEKYAKALSYLQEG